MSCSISLFFYFVLHNHANNVRLRLAQLWLRLWLERQDEMRVHEQDAKRFIINLGQAIFSSSSLYFQNFWDLFKI
jgi:hypothetical protein